MITINRSIQVKIILTESSRQSLLAEYGRQLEQAQTEWEQWQFQRKKLLREAERRPGEAARLARERLEQEDRARQEKLERIRFQLEQVKQLPLDSEIPYTTVDSPIQVRVGDVWDEIMNGTEILLKDGVVWEIRERVPRNGS